MDYYDFRQAAAVVAIASVIYALHRRYNRPSIKDIPGLPNPSWVYGGPGDLVSFFILLTVTSKGTSEARAPNFHNKACIPRAKKKQKTV